MTEEWLTVIIGLVMLICFFVVIALPWFLQFVVLLAMVIFITLRGLMND